MTGSEISKQSTFDEPVKSGDEWNSFLRAFLWACGSILIYVLGLGPANWLAIHGALPEAAVANFYLPLELLGKSVPVFNTVLFHYFQLWN